MLSWRLMGALGGSILINLNMTTCRSPGETEPDPAPQSAPADVQLPGVDTSELTAREKREWSSQVSELLAPCPDQPVSIAQCVQESRPCAACVPAARFLVNEVRKGRTRTQAEAAYRARFGKDQVKSIDLADSPRKGSPTAPVVIVEWADFECPACRAASSVLAQTVNKRPDQVQLVFKNYPLDIHPNAETAARAAIAAHRQGKFWQMHDALFSVDTPPTRSVIDGLAKQIGLDAARFAQDIESEAVADRVAQDRKQGEAVRLRATPTIYVNGREFSYSEDLGAELDDWIDLELELLGAAKPDGAEKPDGAAKPHGAAPTDAGSPAPADAGSPAPADAGSPAPQQPTQPAPSPEGAAPKAPAPAPAEGTSGAPRTAAPENAAAPAGAPR
jgi:protein-disulfide isomerase